MKQMESLIRKVMKEELTGVPERKTGHDKKSIGPENTDGLPQTIQPSNGDAPSGGTIYGDDKMGKTGEDSTNDVDKPKKDYNKPMVQKNSLDDARTYIEKAKEIMKEFAKGDDVFAPQPGRTEENPEEMKDAKPKKGNSGFEEKMDEESEEKDDKEDPMKKMYESLKEEIKKESTSRKSIIGVPMQTASTNTIQNSVKEYLTKANLNGLINNK
jgi:hypothetical protein